MSKYLLQILFFSFIIIPAVFAQNDSATQRSHSRNQKNILSINLGAQYGFIFAHSKTVANSKGSNPAGIEFSLGWQKNDTATLDICNCYPRKGLLLSYYDLDNPVFGNNFNVAYFLEPFYRLRKNIYFSFKGIAGLSYLTNPYDEVQNPANQAYSTAINTYGVLGAGLWFRLNDHWWLNGSANFQHISNGGLRKPNSGINWPTAGITLSYHENPMPYAVGFRSKEKAWKDYSVRWELSLFGMKHKIVDESLNKRSTLILGGGLMGSKQVGKLNALNLGIEVFTDRGHSMELKRDSIDASPVRAGLLFGNEFLLGRFFFSQRLGVYFFNESGYSRLFHRWGVNYRLNQHWATGLNLLAHGGVANFFDIKISYSWQKNINRQ